MRKMCFALALILLLGSISVFAADSYTVTEKYTAKFEREQGINSWYFSCFPDGKREDLVYYPESTRWKRESGEAQPLIKSDLTLPGNTIDSGFVFQAPKGGTVRLKGSVKLSSASVELTISKNGTKTLWNEVKSAAKGTDVYVDYEVLTTIKQGDEIWFRVGADGANTNDFTTWWPSVEYTSLNYVPISNSRLDTEYSFEDDFSSKDAWEIKFRDETLYSDMIWDGRENAYVAATATGFKAWVSGDVLRPTRSANCAVVWTAPYSGAVSVKTSDAVSAIDDSVVLAKIVKNADEKNMTEIWKQVISSDEDGIYDVKVPVSKGDRLFFEAEYESGSVSGGIVWNPELSYVQSGIFTEDGDIFDEISEVSDGDTVYCELRDNGVIESDSIVFLALYDDNGLMRSISPVVNYTAQQGSEQKISAGITFNFGEESYEGWKLSLLIWSSESGRFFTTNLAEEICLK